MNSPTRLDVDFSDTLSKLQNDHLWEYQVNARRACPNVVEATQAALQRPLDFPPLEAAVVPGDRVALAVDPNVPEVEQVLDGVVRALSQAGAGEIDIVLSDEATDQTMRTVSEKLGDRIQVSRHLSVERASLRYLGPDEGAEPVYLNRYLVDADLVLPITAGRLHDPNFEHDMTGVFPAFADSRAKERYLQQQLRAARLVGRDRDTQQPAANKVSKSQGSFDEPAWLLGVQVMVSVSANERGHVAQVLAGTPDAIRKAQAESRQVPDEFPPSAPLVIASLDGGPQQQSWINAARAAAAASRYTRPHGTIVLWSQIDQSLASSQGTPVSSAAADDQDDRSTQDAGPVRDDDDEFPDWDENRIAASVLDRIAEEYRLLIHSRLDQETIEAMGYGVVASEEQLNRLSQSQEACGVLRAAQFAGSPYQA